MYRAVLLEKNNLLNSIYILYQEAIKEKSIRLSEGLILVPD